MNKKLELFLTFAKIGAVCFGGGYAMLPLLEREIVNNKKWATQEEILDYYAIGQCTPGVIAVNVSTFVGHSQAGVLGAVAATAGMVFVPTIIILLIASLLTNFADNIYVQRAFSGIQVCVCVLILDAVSKLWSKSIKNRFGLTIFAVVLILALFTDISTGFFVVAAGIAGFLFGKFSKKEAEK